MIVISLAQISVITNFILISVGIVNLITSFYLQFFYLILKVIKNALRHMLAYFFLIFINFIGLAVFLNIIYGDEYEELKNLSSSIYTVIIFPYKKLSLVLEMLENKEYSFISGIFVIYYSIQIKFILTNIYFVIIYESFSKSIMDTMELLKYSDLVYGIKYFSQNLFHKIEYYGKLIKEKCIKLK